MKKPSIKDVLSKPVAAAEDSMEDMGDYDAEDGTAVNDAAADVQAAISGTPEEFAKAMKTFLAVCE